MPVAVFAQLVALCAGLLLLTAVLIVWRRSLVADVRLLALQGMALAALVCVIGIDERSSELIWVAVLVLVLKGVLLPGRLAGALEVPADSAATPTLPWTCARTWGSPSASAVASPSRLSRCAAA